MNHPGYLLIALGLAAMAHSAPVAAGPPTDPKACAAIDADAQRLACYDAWFRKTALAEQATAARAEPAAAAPAAEAASQAEARFGLIERAEPVQVKELTSRVVEVGRRAADRVVLTLENGQRWQTNEAADARYFRPGDLVTIEPAALGSFRARKEGRNKAFPVRRVD